MIKPLFVNDYNEKDFIEFIQEFIPSISLNVKRQEVRTGFSSIQQIAESSDSDLDLAVFIARPESSINARIEITKNTYSVLKSHARSNALIAYISDDSSEWRLSLITTKVTRTTDGIKESVSNPRRFSYVLGPTAKVVTPSKMLQGTIGTIKDLEDKFSLEVVSKEFYTRIAIQYSKLAGGTRGEGKKAVHYDRTLGLGTIDDSVNANFAIRLIGRLVFCWFLKQKKGQHDNPLIPNGILSVDAVKKIEDYYHSVCVPLFFEVLNKQQSSRPTFFAYTEFFDKVPFLNGGLFQDHAEDNHKFNRTTGVSDRRGVVNVPDGWFSELFQIFEEYNFTIDENTSLDTELSIDPEMLGRIFENLLAEVNPETGASARKSTGSFYTPREIVDFMVEESLVQHLKNKTNISEEKLRSLSSYGLEDDILNPLEMEERKILVEAIHDTTVLDPACGSGAFPIGVLQRMVHMLEVLDPDCSIYLSRLPLEVRRQFQKDKSRYIRKLGIIRGCIHGIDIQPIATDISRLRCFLTLVVDQHVDDNIPNRGIEPLPNLDFKFVCANTLISPPIQEGSLFGDEFANELGELVDDYFAPIDQIHKLETVTKLQRLINEKTKKEMESIINDSGLFNDPKLMKLYKSKKNSSNEERLRLSNLWDSYKNIFENKAVGFFDTRYFFPTVFRNGGFDIVIGNPPYGILNKKQNKEESIIVSSEELEYYKNIEYYAPAAGGMLNIFRLFIVRSINLLAENGVFSEIFPLAFTGDLSSSKLRKYILDHNEILSIEAFPERDNPLKRVFEGVKMSVCILNLRKNKKENPFFVRINSDRFVDLEAEKNYLTKDIISTIDSSHFTFPLANTKEANLLSKVFSKSLRFDKIGNCITGEVDMTFCKSSFTDNTKDAILLKGAIIDRYQLRTKMSQGEIKFINEPILFAIKKGLPKDLKDQERIVLQGITGVNESSRLKMMIIKNAYCANSLNYLKLKKDLDLRYLLGIFNSKLLNFIFSKLSTNSNVNGYEVDNLPIVINIDFVGQIVKTVDKILTITKSSDYLENLAKKDEVKEYEKQIDELVYKLYDLTPEEIEAVENSSKK